MKKSLLTKAVILIILLLVSFYAYLWINLSKSQVTKPKAEKVILQVGSTRMVAEIADSPEELAKGLSGRDSLDANSGMYFILGGIKEAIFHMRGMRFPLDIIWIDEGKVVGIEKSAPVPKNGFVPVFKSPQLVSHVLEVTAGYTKRNNIEIGEVVEVVR